MARRRGPCVRPRARLSWKPHDGRRQRERAAQPQLPTHDGPRGLPCRLWRPGAGRRAVGRCAPGQPHALRGHLASRGSGHAGRLAPAGDLAGGRGGWAGWAGGRRAWAGAGCGRGRGCAAWDAADADRWSGGGGRGGAGGGAMLSDVCGGQQLQLRRRPGPDSGAGGRCVRC